MTISPAYHNMDSHFRFDFGVLSCENHLICFRFADDFPFQALFKRYSRATRIQLTVVTHSQVYLSDYNPISS